MAPRTKSSNNSKSPVADRERALELAISAVRKNHGEGVIRRFGDTDSAENVPAISTGAFGFPMEQAAEVASRTVLARTGDLKSVRRLRWVLFSEEDRMLHERVFESILNA